MSYIVIVRRRYMKIVLSLIISIIIAALAYFPETKEVFAYFTGNQEIEDVLKYYFNQRCEALLSGDTSVVRGQFDMSSKYGKWSYEHEAARIKFVRDWSAVRDVIFKKCETNLKIFSIKGSKGNVKVYLNDRTRMAYMYNNERYSQLNEFCVGTMHSMTLVSKGGVWYVTADWYNDPLDDSIPESQTTFDDTAEDIQTGTYTWVKYDRVKAVEYADKYCGANFNMEDGYKYNKKYRNFADLGGDCANFASQILSDKDAGCIRQGGNWLYMKGEGSASWLNAGSFIRSMLYSGKARLVSRGKYEKAINSIHSVSPGDIIAYEKKGDIVHVSVVVAADSKGVPLVDSHTNDRYHVPWDLGWNSSNVTYWFLKING